jgi:hypothetical protein
MSQTLHELNGVKPKELVETATKINKDPLIAKFAEFIGDIDPTKSILESVIDNMLECGAVIG